MVTGARSSCRARSGAPIGRAERSTRKRGSCTSSRSPAPFTADLVKPDPKSLEPRLRAGHAGVDPGAAGAAAVQAAVRPHHRDRFEPGRTAVDDAERRRPARPSAAETAEPSAARQPGPQLAARDEDAAVPRRRRPDHGGARIAAPARDARVDRARATAAGSSARSTRRPARCSGRRSCPPASPARR